MNNKIYNTLLVVAACTMLLLLAGMFYSLFSHALPAFRHFGFFQFLSSAAWDSQPGAERYGAWSFITGTVLTAILAVAISIPFSLALGLYTGDLHRGRRISRWIGYIIDYAAVLPSIIIGIWGYYILRPILISLNIGDQGFGILSAAIVLSLMITPYCARFCTTLIRQIPTSLKEAAAGLGANRMETAYKVILPLTGNGILGAHVLALGRALGEMVIVSIMIGNTLGMPQSINDTGSSMSSLLANQFGGAGDLKFSAIVAVAFLLFMLTLIVNLIGRLIINKSSGR